MMGKIVCAKTLRIKRGPENTTLVFFWCSVAICNYGKLSEDELQMHRRREIVNPAHL